MTTPEASDTSGLRRLFTKPDFDVDRFVKNTLRDWNQSTEVMVDKLAGMSEDASSKMKQAIFENYKLFIKVGKTATVLEATMHQIHSEFAESQQLMNSLVQLSLFNEALPDVPTPSKNSTIIIEREPASSQAEVGLTGPPVSSIFSTIHGASQILSDDLTRRVFHTGEVLELSADTQSIICVARLVLLNDLLLVAYKQPGRSGETQFRIQAMYSLENVGLLTSVPKDRRHAPQNTFKLTVSNITRMFQAESAEIKQNWVRAIEEAKRVFAASQSSKTASKMFLVNGSTSSSRPISMAPEAQSSPQVIPSFAIPPDRASVEAVRSACKALASTLPECADMLTPIPQDANEQTPGRKNPFAGRSSVMFLDNSFADSDKSWLWGVPEDLEVAISERDFTRATDLIIKTHRTIEQLRQSSERHGTKSASDLSALANRVEQIKLALTEALQQELLTAADRHGAPQCVSSAIMNLNRLGKGTLAAQLFLLYRSNLIIKSVTRGIRQEGSQLLFLNRLSFAFHRNLAESAAEWQRVIVQPLIQQSQDASDGLQLQLPTSQEVKKFEKLLSLRFCSWVLEESEKFGDQLRVMLMDTRSICFATLALVSQRISAHAEKLSSLLGIDILSTIQACLMPAWKMAIEKQAQLLKDNVENRVTQETWEPTPANEVQEQMKELCDLGLVKRASSTSRICLTTSSFQLARSLCGVVQNYRRLQCDELEPVMMHSFVSVLQLELENYQKALSNSQLEDKKPVIVSNLEFLFNNVIPKLMKHINGARYPESRELVQRFREMLATCTKPSDAANL